MINFTGGEGQKWGDPLPALVEANSHSTWPLPASQGHGLEPKWLEPKWLRVEGLGFKGLRVRVSGLGFRA